VSQNAAQGLDSIQKPADAGKGNWLTGDGVHMKPLGDAVIWVIAEVQIGTAAFVLGRCGGQARPTGRVGADS
jgi:hypothetical protein